MSQPFVLHDVEELPPALLKHRVTRDAPFIEREKKRKEREERNRRHRTKLKEQKKKNKVSKEKRRSRQGDL
jgi:hypothetical protein